MGSPNQTMIYCRKCGYTVTGEAETIPQSQLYARMKWADRGALEEDDRKTSGLLEDD